MASGCSSAALLQCFAPRASSPRIVVLPFLYETATIQRRSLHRSTSRSQDPSTAINETAQQNPTAQPQEEHQNSVIRFTKEVKEQRHKFRGGPDGRFDQSSHRRPHDSRGAYNSRQPHRNQRSAEAIDRSGNTGKHLIRNYDPLARSNDSADSWHHKARNLNVSQMPEPEEEPLPSHFETKVMRAGGPASYGTMTDAERAAFSKLFKSLSPENKPQRQEAVGEQSHAAQAFGPSLVDDSSDIHGGEHMDRRLESILNRELQRDQTSISRYPDTLRGMAATARLQLAREKMVQEQKKDQVGLIAEANAEIQRVWKKLSKADTDVGVWKMLEEHVFEPFRRLELDKPPASPAPVQPANATATENKKNTASTEPVLEKQKPEMALTARTYPHHIFNAATILCKRTAYTPLVGTILPALRSLGTSSYVLGISTGLFNQLLEYNWRVTNDWRTMLLLLQEMDDAALTLDNGTWSVLEDLTLYRYRALRGDFGEGVRLMEGMSERFRQGKQLWTWKKEIKERTEQAALERAREGESGMGEGFAVSDEPDVVLNKRHRLSAAG